jgi:sec-independent protein translocase protein TatC
MTGPGGEMPFLDHLEELRTRLIKSLLALIGGFAIGLWIVQRLDLIVWLKRPIAQYLAYTGGKLVITNPTDSVMIVLKLSFVVGTVLASPVLIYQAWAFLSPALYERERRTMAPALLVGLLLFLVGAGLGWYFVVPQALRVFLGFQSEALAYVITYTEYFSFILQIVIALGLSFELPLVIIILAGLGLVTPAALNRFRRFWLVLACIAGALLSPGADVISMIMMTIPLLLLYEVGFAGAVIIQRRRIRAAATAGMVLLGLLLSGG